VGLEIDKTPNQSIGIDGLVNPNLNPNLIRDWFTGYRSHES